MTAMFYHSFENIDTIFHMKGVLYFLIYPCFLIDFSVKKWLLWQCHRCYHYHKIFYTFITSIWGTEWMQVYIIIKISAKLMIFDWNRICICGYWFLICYTNSVIVQVITIFSEWSFFERPIGDYTTLPIFNPTKIVYG